MNLLVGADGVTPLPTLPRFDASLPLPVPRMGVAIRVLAAEYDVGLTGRFNSCLTAVDLSDSLPTPDDFLSCVDLRGM